MSSTTASASASQTSQDSSGSGQNDVGIGITSFLSAITVAIIIFAVQTLLFLLLRNKLSRIYKPKTYLVPERERTDSPPHSVVGMLRQLLKVSDRDLIKKCGLDAYFFLRYLKTLLVIFIPICAVVLPILIPLNYVGGRGSNVDAHSNSGDSESSGVSGLDTLAWGNVKPKNTSRYAAHLVLALLVIIWVCGVFFFELRVYIKIRQDYLTSAEHRLRASATTVLVNSIPRKWLSEEALRGLFDVFPGGIKNIWLNRNLKKLLEKVKRRDKISKKLEKAETKLIRKAKKAQLKKQESEEKKQRKELKVKSMSKTEKAAKNAKDDAEALRMANSGQGIEAGDKHETPHNIAAGMRMSQHGELNHPAPAAAPKTTKFKIPLIGDPLSKVSEGILGVVDKAGNEVEGTLETTNGFIGLGATSTQSRHDPDLQRSNGEGRPRPSASDTLGQQSTRSRSDSAVTNDSTKAMRKETAAPPAPALNTVRKLANIDDMYNKDETKIWQFWKEPTGGYATPVPQGADSEDYLSAGPSKKKKKPFWHILPFVGGDDEEVRKYPPAYNKDYDEEKEGPAVWEKYLKQKDRPTHRLSLFGVMALPGVPLINKKVDTIHWCREELARLNLEIEEDQKDPERFPLMNSAFIQFEYQVAAHMACQSIVHHVPRQMAPRIVEVSPRDVIWNNMAFSWWEEWLRTGAAYLVVLAMVLLWAIPVAWTAALGQLDELVQEQPWLSFLTKNHDVEVVAQAIAGFLPAAVLSLLLFLVPYILQLLAGFKGVKTGAQKTEFVQIFYFCFLFIQVFLIVSIASFFAASLNQLVQNIEDLQTITDVLDLLAKNLPKAAIYFFQYMILQAMSVSSGTLLQIGTLFTWYILSRMLDSTARSKWRRNTDLSNVRWGTFFPVYTNFACIVLVYCVIAPLISIFALITFGLLWVAHRYSMLYVVRFESDTGGVLYPRAINQTFTGLYVMELCMAGLFFIVVDEHGKHPCTPHGAIMLVALLLTIIYQVLLNMSFSPLFRYLPITFEDEAVLRDQAFQRAQDRRLGLINQDEDEDDDYDEDVLDGAGNGREKSPRLGNNGQGIEMSRLGSRNQAQNMLLRNPIKQVGSWAKDGGNQLRKLKITTNDPHAAEYRRQQRHKDLEALQAMGDALYGGFHDEIEDLTPDERDWLTQEAFQHSALRARRTTVWLPRDDLGISADEIRRTNAYSDNIWITNEGTALDSKVRVVYGKNPPDFSEIDLISL